MEFRCQFTYMPQPCEPGFYIRPMTIDIFCLHEVENELAGRLAIDHLDLMRANSDGVNVFDICDSDSQGWGDVYEATLESKKGYAELRQEFEMDEPREG